MNRKRNTDSNVYTDDLLNNNYDKDKSILIFRSEN